MKQKIKMWALYERDFGKICWSAMEGGTMIFNTRKEAKKMKAEIMSCSDMGDSKITVVPVSIKGNFPK